MFLNKTCNSLCLLANSLNRKHEMFLNTKSTMLSLSFSLLNRKHEMFLNKIGGYYGNYSCYLTVNMKCF